MRKFVDMAAMLRETAERKQRAAQMRRAGTPEGLDEPSVVYEAACAAIGQALAPAGFRYAKSGPHLRRNVGDFTHEISFQSSHHNVRGEYVALWIHAAVRSKSIKAWRRRQDPQIGWDRVAGGQIGNLEPEPGWSEWNLADPETRSAAVNEAVGAIQRTILPFFALFVDRGAALTTLDTWPTPGVEPVPAIELALAYDDRARAQRLLQQFFHHHADLLPKYRTALLEFRSAGVPSYRPAGYAAELAKATIEYGLTPIAAA